MDLRTIIRTIGRHPVIIVGGLVLTLMVSAVLVSRVEPEYQADASVLLYGPLSTPNGVGGETPQNPLEDPRSVGTTANALVAVMLSPPFANRLAEAGLQGDYSVSIDPSAGGAILAVGTKAPTAAGAYDGLNLVLDHLQAELKNFQQGIGVAERVEINSRVITFPDEASAVTGSKTRVLVISLAIGLLLTYGLAALAEATWSQGRESRRERRRRRKAEKAGSEPIDLPNESEQREHPDPTTVILGGAETRREPIEPVEPIRGDATIHERPSRRRRAV